MFSRQYWSAQYFDPVWFAPGDESHLLPEERYRPPVVPSVSGADGAVRSSSKKTAAKSKNKGKAPPKPILQLLQPLQEDRLNAIIREEDEELLSVVSLLVSTGTIT